MQNNPFPGIGMWSVAQVVVELRSTTINLQNTVVRDLAKGTNRLVWTVNYLTVLRPTR